MILRLEQYLARVAGGTGAIPESPETNTEAYLAILAGENRQAPEPITRLDMYLYNLVGGNYPIPTPNTRIEQYLAKACGLETEVPTPITREEQLWYAIAQPSWQLATLTGTLPLTFESKGGSLTDYKLYGTSAGAGVQTENMCDCTTFAAGHLNASGNVDYVSDTTYVNGLPDGSIEFTTNAGWRGVHTEKFLIPTGATKIRFLYQGLSNNNQFRFCFYDLNGDFVSQSVQAGSNDFTITIPNSVASVAVSIQLSTATTYSFTKLRLYTNLDTVTDFIPYGYKLPMTVESGETENFYDDETSSDKILLNSLGGLSNNNYYKTSDYIDCTGSSKINCYGVSVFDGYRLVRIAFYDNNHAFLSGMDSEVFISGNYSFTFTAPQNACYFRFSFIRTDTDVSATLRYTSDIPIYIGDSKLGEEEYVDYESGKIYRKVNNVLTPIDPPVALPELSTYQGENTLSCSEELGECSITGYIKEAGNG